MKTKIIPFDLETAKKIQAGEIEGKIKYSESDGYAYNADIIKFDLIADKSKAKPNSTLFRTIVAVVDFDNYQGVRTFNSAGYGCYNGDDTKLFIEVPDDEPQFKPFDKVLVRDEDFQTWSCSIFSHLKKDQNGIVSYNASGLHWNQCIPYEGNQDLVGTTKKPKED